MKRNSLTARQVQFMKPDPERRFEVPAGPPIGLYLIVHKTGRKSWALRYRWNGRPRKLTLKESYPSLSLAQARSEAEVALEAFRNGVDPAAEKTAAKPDTFKAVAKEFIERYAKRNRSWPETERILNREAVSKWGNRPVHTITRADVLRVLDGISDRGAEIMSNRTHAALGRLFNWCLERGILESSPMAGVRSPGAEQSRDRVLSDSELLEVWRAAEVLGYPVGHFYQVLLLTCQRRGEVATMRWQDVDWEAALWTLTAAQTKSGRPHDVPLSGAVMDILESLPRFDGGDFVFSPAGGKKPISSFSEAVARLKATILEARKERSEVGAAVPDWTVHDLRRSAATHMAKSNIPPHVVAAILNHSPGRTMGISAVYIRHQYRAERREALESWAGFVLGLTASKPSITTVSAQG